MRETHHVMLGIFVLVGATLLVGGIALVGGQRIVASGMPMETVFAESVQGLEIGSPVRFRGVKIGEVDEITFANRYYDTEYRYALVRVKIARNAFRSEFLAPIPQQLEQLIREGLRVQLAAQGLTGVMYLETDMFDEEQYPILPIDWVPEYPYVPSVRSTLRQLGDSLTTTLESLAKAPITQLVDEMRESLASLRHEVESMQLGDRSQEFAALVGRSKAELERLGPEFDRLLGDLRGATTRADEFLVASRAKLDGLELQPVVAELRTVLGEVRTTMTKLETAVGQADAFVADQRRGGAGLFENLREIATNLGRLTATLERYPSLLLLGEPPKKER